MPPAEAAPASLLTLPWDIRSAILLEVLTPQRRREPAFDKKFTQQRVHLRNCFDERNPKATNIYIEKPGSWPLAQSARALQATNRQLRDDVTLLIDKTLKTGMVKAPFVLDIMVVKDVGVFPTWLCFPYKTKRIQQLRVNVRIIRPDAKASPLEWVELARFPEKRSGYNELETSTFWSFYAALALISLSRLRYKPAAVDKTTSISSAKTPTAEAKVSPATGSKPGNRSIAMDAYLVPIEATPYVVDRLLLNFKPVEDRSTARPTVYGVYDNSRDGPFHKEGYVQFGRDVFYDIEDSLRRITDYRIVDDELAFYQYALANSAGEVTYSMPDGDDGCFMSKNTDSWISEFEHDVDWRTINITKAIAEEKASRYPSQGYIDVLQLAKRRRALGWQAQFDEEQRKATKS
ncbi:Protein kinase-like protein [Cordyceps javanica]|uniref:Protein kinase-like protein n=1 Tax=Cordyceps javanica TaxID=43265 RepID=A0A545VBG7_9HYPO|nr:Protein kinase-like protein [Cordyceps javanica]TQW10263.1 Protein kinase-like protein [Cordyceps javanica]